MGTRKTRNEEFDAQATAIARCVFQVFISWIRNLHNVWAIFFNLLEVMITIRIGRIGAVTFFFFFWSNNSAQTLAIYTVIALMTFELVNRNWIETVTKMRLLNYVESVLILSGRGQINTGYYNWSTIINNNNNGS